MAQWKNQNSLKKDSYKLRESNFKEDEVIAKVYVELYEDDPKEGEGNLVNSYSKTMKAESINRILDKLSYRYGASKNLRDWCYYENSHEISTTSEVDENEIPLTDEENEDFLNGKIYGYALTLFVVFYSNRKVASLDDIEESCGSRIGDIV